MQAWNCFLKAASDLQRGRETDGGGGKPGRRASRVGEKKERRKTKPIKGEGIEDKEEMRRLKGSDGWRGGGRWWQRTGKSRPAGLIKRNQRTGGKVKIARDGTWMGQMLRGGTGPARLPPPVCTGQLQAAASTGSLIQPGSSRCECDEMGMSSGASAELKIKQTNNNQSGRSSKTPK